jgi:tol-pal system protein YbgF
MKIHRYAAVLALPLVLWLAVTPAWGVSKEIIELQTQVQALQDQMARMQQSFDERMGVMKNLMDQNTDSMNKVGASIGTLQTSLQKQQGEDGTRVDQLSGQIQTLNDSLDELKARLGKVSKQLEDMQAAQQNLSSQQQASAAGQAAGTGQPSTQPSNAQALAAQAPPPDVLYNNGLRDYNAGNGDLATQEFSDYIKFYPNTDLAGNAYFYSAELAYRQGNYQAAVKNYDQVLQSFPDGNKAAAAELKKGYALVELGQKDDGIASLRHVVQRYPRSNEALQAKERLHKMGVATTTTARKSASRPQ